MSSRRKSLLVLFVILVNAFIVGLLVAQDTPPPHWMYEGEEGPDHWGEIDPLFEACALGVEQSPIDLSDSEMFDLVDIQTDYQSSALTILNNGHTVQANYDAAAPWSSMVRPMNCCNSISTRLANTPSRGNRSRWKFILYIATPKVAWR